MQKNPESHTGNRCGFFCSQNKNSDNYHKNSNNSFRNIITLTAFNKLNFYQSTRMRYLFNIFLIYLFINLLSPDIWAQSSYLVTHFSRSQYQGGSQNWSIDMDKKGYVFVANNEGLLVYDGVKWKLHRIPAQTILRSVSAAIDGRIYIGSYEEFGYWKETENKQLKYQSLIPLLNDVKLHNTEIWKIIQLNNKVYFQGFSALLVYDQKTIKSIQLPGSIIFLLKVGNRLFVQAVKGNLYEIVNDKLVNIDKNNVLQNTEVKTMLPFGENSFLIGTSSNGLYKFDGNTVKPWNIQANNLLTEYQINNGIVFNDKFVFGTIVKGIFILDSEGNILNHIHSENDLQNNTVLSLYNDNNRNIWVGLDNGIDFINFDNPIDIYQHHDEARGAVYTAALSGNTLYVGTNRGIFTYTKKGESFSYNGFLKNSQGQVWEIKEIDGVLLCGHTNGTYIIRNNKLELISSVNGGFMLQKLSNKGTDYLIQSTYSSLVIYKKNGNTWEYSHQIEGFMEPARFIETDHLGNIWIAHSVKGLYRIKLNEQCNKVNEIQIYGQKDGLPSDFNIRVFKISNRIVFSTGLKLFTWDDLNQKIIPWGEYNQKLNGFESSSCISKSDDARYWFVNHDELALFNIKSNHPDMIYRLILLEYNIRMVDNYENIIMLSDSLNLICLDNGFAVLRNSNIKPNSTEKTKVHFREFLSGNTKNETEIFDLEE